MTNLSKPGNAGKGFLETRYLKDLDRIDGEQMEFEWPLGILDENHKKMMSESKCELEHFQGRIIFMSMYNDIDRRKRGNGENCIANALQSYRVCSKIHPRTSVTSWDWIGEKWYAIHVSKPDGE